MEVLQIPKKFDDLQQAIKRQLKKDNPNLSDDELTSRSFAIATANWKRAHGGKAPSRENVEDKEIDSEEKLDEDGRIIVAENVKIFIEGRITSITE